MALHAWNKRRGWVILLSATCVLVVAVIAGIVMSVSGGHSEAFERRSDFQSALRTILQYAPEEEFAGIPGGCYSHWHEEKVLYSWRRMLLPWMDHVGEASGIPSGVDERWDSETNQRITRRGYGVDMRMGKSPFASIFGFVGEDAAFVERQCGQGQGIGTIRRRQLKELPSDLLVIIGVNQSQVEWSQPGDIRAVEFEGVRNGITLGQFSLCRGETWVGFVDGEMWLLSSETPISEIAKFCRIPLAEKYDREEVLSKYRIDSYKVPI